MAIANPDNKYGVAKWIVDPVAGNGTHTTIASALASASSGDDIFIRPGTYTENLTIKAGVNLVAFPTDPSGNVTIVGNLTSGISGTASFSGIRFQTPSGNYIFTSFGSDQQTHNFYNCYFNCTLFGAIANTNSNASSRLNFYNCTGDLATTGIGFISTSNNTVSIYNTVITNSGGSSGANSINSGTLRLINSEIYSLFQAVSTGQFEFRDSLVDTSAINAVCMNSFSTSGSSSAYNCRFASGSAACINIDASHTATLSNCVLNSSATNAITGTGAISYSNLIFSGSSTGLSMSTQTPLPTGPGNFRGLVTGTPGAGFIGQQIRSAISSASSVSITNNTQTNITSISLTAGIWDVTGIVMYTGSLTGTFSGASINTVSATLGTIGDNYITIPLVSTAIDLGIVVPPYRISLTSTTTVYLIGYCSFSSGTCQAYGRISATRVG